MGRTSRSPASAAGASRVQQQVMCPVVDSKMLLVGDVRELDPRRLHVRSAGTEEGFDPTARLTERRRNSSEPNRRANLSFNHIMIRGWQVDREGQAPDGSKARGNEGYFRLWYRIRPGQEIARYWVDTTVWMVRGITVEDPGGGQGRDFDQATRAADRLSTRTRTGANSRQRDPILKEYESAWLWRRNYGKAGLSQGPHYPLPVRQSSCRIISSLKIKVRQIERDLTVEDKKPPVTVCAGTSDPLKTHARFRKRDEFLYGV